MPPCLFARAPLKYRFRYTGLTNWLEMPYTERRDYALTLKYSTLRGVVASISYALMAWMDLTYGILVVYLPGEDLGVASVLSLSPVPASLRRLLEYVERSWKRARQGILGKSLSGFLGGCFLFQV